MIIPIRMRIFSEFIWIHSFHICSHGGHTTICRNRKERLVTENMNEWRKQRKRNNENTEHDIYTRTRDSYFPKHRYDERIFLLFTHKLHLDVTRCAIRLCNTNWNKRYVYQRPQMGRAQEKDAAADGSNQSAFQHYLLHRRPPDITLLIWSVWEQRRKSRSSHAAPLTSIAKNVLSVALH